MKTKIRNWAKLGMFLGMGAVLFTGCASYTAYRKGNRLLESRDFDQAIVFYEKAATLNPQKVKYQAALLQAKDKGARWHHDEAVKARSQTDLEIAEKHMETAVKYKPSVTQYLELSASIKIEIKSAEDLQKKALHLADSGNYDEGVSTMRSCLKAYRSIPSGDDNLKTLVDQACRFHADKARQFLDKDDWDSSEAEAKKALDYINDYSEARSILRIIDNRREAQRQIETAARLSASQELRMALAALEKAKELHPERKDLLSRIDACKKAICDQIIGKGNELFASGEYIDALLDYRESEQILPQHGNISALVDRAEEALAGIHLKRAREYESRSLYGNSLIEYLLCLAYAPNDADATGGHRRCHDVLAKDTHYSIGLLGFSAPQNCNDIGASFEAAVVQHLARVKPPNVSLVDSEHLKPIIDEISSTQADLVDAVTKMEAGRIKGLDAIIVGRVGGFKIMVDKTHAEGRSVFQDGMKLVHNTEYDEAQQQVNSAMRELRAARQELAGAQARANINSMWSPRPGDAFGGLMKGLSTLDSAVSPNYALQHVATAETNLQNAQFRLANTPQQEQVPNMMECRYPIYTTKVTSRVDGFLKVLDCRTGEVFVAESIFGSYSASDRHVEGDAFRNIPNDPLDLPDESSLRYEAITRAIQKIESAVENIVYKHGHRFAVLYRNAEKSGDKRDMMEWALRYLYAYPTGFNETETMVANITNLVGRESDFLNVPGLLKTYSHVILELGKLPFVIEERGGELVVVNGLQGMQSASSPPVIRTIDGQPVSGEKSLNAILSRYGAGDKVSVCVEAASKSDVLEITLTSTR